MRTPQDTAPGVTLGANRAAPVCEKGMVLQIQSMSVNDGEGIRTVIFLPGCPLRCRWCANPEAWTPLPKLAVFHGKCTGCGTCRSVCPAGLNPPLEGENLPAACRACGMCARVCPSGALTLFIAEMTAEEVTNRVERDAVFFRASGGGVTFSGGEPTFQTGFLRALVREFDRRGIDMCMETCGHFQWEHVADILAKLSHVLYDCKHMDPVAHKMLTGVSNETILENCARLRGAGIPVTVRVPVIASLTGSRENLEATARFIKERAPGASIELLPYHDLGREKYRAIGLPPYAGEGFAAPSEQAMAQAEQMFREAGIAVVRYR